MNFADKILAFNQLHFNNAILPKGIAAMNPDDKRTITFKVEGDAILIGDNPRNAEAGISTILLKAGQNPGDIRIKATAEGLSTGEIQIKML